MLKLRNHRLFFRIVLFLLAASFLVACAPTASPAAAPAGSAADSAGNGQVQRLRVAIIGDESTLTPYTYVTGYPGWNLLTLQYDTLYQLDLNGVPKPWLATDAALSEDGLTVTLTLRDDVTWHDGQPLTAEDIKFTFDYFKANQQGRFTRDLRPVASTAVDDEGRVVVTLSAPAPSLELGTLADVPILPKHIWEGVANPAEHTFEGVTNIGTGPYQLAEYQPEQFYRFTANPDYFAGAPAVAELVAIKFADDAGALAALRGGEVDMIVRPVAPEQIDLLSALPGMKVAQGPLFTTQMLTYDMTKPPFNRLEVRQAMALAIDRQDIIDTVYLGAGTVGSAGWIHPQSPVYNDAVVTETDPERAAQLLEEAGITDSDGDGIRELEGAPLSFEFLVNGSDSLRLRIAELVSQMLKEIGIEASVAAVEQATWEEAVWPGFDVANGRNYDMAMWGWSAPIQADATRIASLVHSDPAIGTSNLSGYQSTQADEIAAAITTEMNPERSAELIRELQTIIAADLPFILLLYPDGAYAYNASVYDGWAFMTGQGVFHKLSFLPEAARP
ncbi:MAG: ABC transporter substrate-binding protein [Chloroflexi bacterium]|nr:MAG: ABC transporter substrate-binding protein [Chloroflexota bacterium]